MSFRRMSTAAALAGALALTACGSPDPAPAAPGAPVELSVSLFGTFGYDEVGLFRRYEAEHPGVTIRYESTQGEDKYWPALQTRLASGSGVADVQGIEVARIADVVTNQPDRWTDLRDTPAAASIGNYIDWKEKAATTPDGAVLGLGTDIGPMGICYRSDLLGAAGLPTDPAQLSAQMPDWNGFLALGEKFKAAAPAGTAWHDSANGLYNAIISSQQQIYYDASGQLVYATNPAVRQAFDTAAKAGQEGLTAKLEQFVDPGWDQGFGSGRFATIACPSWMIGYIKGKAGDAGAGKWNVVPLPGGAGGNWGGSYLGIPASSPHKEQAAELIAWLTAPEQQATVFEKVGNFPSTTKAITDVAGTTDPYFNGAPIGQIFSRSATTAPVQILGPQDGVVKNAMKYALLAVETGGATPDAAWADAGKKIESQVG
ncbi:MAG TPA: extracellular solute-binding protein [Pseudonocardia sp.]|jgi:cellobiose transport system substrate-binding protein